MKKEIKIELLTGVSPEEASKYIPATYKLLLKQVKDAIDKIPFFVAESREGDVVGLCIFLTYKANSETAYLLHLNVKEEHRKEGYGSALFNQGFEYLKRAGYSSLKAVVHPQIHDAGFLKKEGFREAGKEIYMTYYTSDLKKCRLSENFDKLRPLINHVKSLSEIPKEDIVSFMELQKRKHSFIDIAKLDPELTECFVDKGNILGYISFSMHESRIITQIDYDMIGGGELKYAYPALLSEVIERTFSEDSDDFMISLYVSNTRQYKALKKLFGEPVEEIVTDLYDVSLK